MNLCAERVAALNMYINIGETKIKRMIVFRNEPPKVNGGMPCGACRQVLAEFCDADFKVFVGVNENDIEEYSLSDLLPYSFNKSKLGD